MTYFVVTTPDSDRHVEQLKEWFLPRERYVKQSQHKYFYYNQNKQFCEHKHW